MNNLFAKSIRSAYVHTVAGTTLSSKVTPVMIQSRNIGFLDSIKDKFSSATAEKKQEQMNEMFGKTREKLLSSPKFRLKEYHELLGDTMKQLDTWKGKISAMAQKEETDAMKRTYSIFDALTPVERVAENLNIINMAVKSRITAATGVQAQEINVELRKFEELKLFHAWLHRRVQKNLPLPQTQIEVLGMMREDPPKISEKYKQDQKSKQRRSNAR